jgi:hypothetical protein
MPDKRRHRGPHPEDEQLFAVELACELREATRDLSWLLTKGYAGASSLKLVGDRYRLNARQRLAVSRCACADQSAARRQRHRVSAQELDQRELWIDGYNVLTSVEAALSGGVILHARDGSYRDMASMHGSYRKVEETIPAIHLLGELLAEWNVSGCRWVLDEPVSNSGRLKSLLQELGNQRGWNWTAELAHDPDALLIRSDQIVASADSQVLDRAERWFNLVRSAVEARIGDAWIIDLSS